MTEQQWSSASYEAVAEIVAERTGLTFGPARRLAVEAGIRRAMKETGMTDVGRYRPLLQTDQRALDELVIQLTVGETYFLRNPEHFEFVRRQILPDIRRRRGPDHVVRAWSAGCSTGEEAYSLAIVFEEEGLADRSSVLATDISRASLKAARRAHYRPWAMRGMSAQVRERCFRQVPHRELGRRASQFVLARRLRQHVNFEYQNLALDPYPSLENGTWGMDLIMCRNVLIYFDRETIRRVAERLARCLADGGWLMLGPSDPPLQHGVGLGYLEPIVSPSGVFFRRGTTPLVLVPDVSWADQMVTQTPVAPYSPAPPEIPQRAAPVGADEPVVQEAPEAGNVLAEAETALGVGEYVRAVELLREHVDDAAACALHVRALSNIEVSAAERACAEALEPHPLSAELHHLRTLLLMALGRYEDALGAARRVLYLDDGLACGHLVLASILRHQGDLDGARRAYRNARQILTTRPADEPVPLCGDGETAGRLAEVAAIELGLLETAQGVHV